MFMAGPILLVNSSTLYKISTQSWNATNFNPSIFIISFCNVFKMCVLLSLHCSTMHCSALHCTALHYISLHCSAVQYTSVQCNKVQCSAMQQSLVQNSAVQCIAAVQKCRSAVQCSAVYYSAMQCSAMYRFYFLRPPQQTFYIF